MLLGRAASLAYPVYHGRGFAQLDSSFGSLVRGEIAHARGDKVGVRRSLTDATQRRSNLRPADLTLDAVYPEAWLYAAVGDSASALAVLGRVLDALAATPAIIFFDVANAGSLSQAMLLRAHLAAEDRDRSGVRKWARALMAITDSSTSLGRTRYQAAQALSR
jgi:hypothetical protein